MSELLDEQGEFSVVVDNARQIGGRRVKVGESVVLVMEDPYSIACVEMPQAKLKELIVELNKLTVNDGT